MEIKKRTAKIIAVFSICTIVVFIVLVSLFSSKNEVNPQDDSSELQTKPNVAIVVFDLGMDKELLLKSCELPKSIHLGVLPYANLNNAMGECPSRKFIMNIPAETSDYFNSDSGPLSLQGSLSMKQNSERLNLVIQQGVKANGFYMSINDSFTDKESNAKFVWKNISKEGKFLIYNDPSLIKIFPKDRNILKANIVLDRVEEYRYFKANLNKLFDVGGSNIVVMIRAKNIHYLKLWLQENDRSKFNLVSIDEMIK